MTFNLFYSLRTDNKIDKTITFVHLRIYFYFLALSPIIGFLPTIARQLGYSITTYGTVMMFMSMMSTILCPLIGIISERFHKKNLLYFILVLLMGSSSFLYMFVPKVPLEIIVKLQCDTGNTLFVTAESGSLKSPNGTLSVNKGNGESIACKVSEIIMILQIVILWLMTI